MRRKVYNLPTQVNINILMNTMRILSMAGSHNKKGLPKERKMIFYCSPDYVVIILLIIRRCRSGETGRHAVFRAQCLNGRGGSNPPFGIFLWCQDNRKNGADGGVCRPRKWRVIPNYRLKFIEVAEHDAIYFITRFKVKITQIGINSAFFVQPVAMVYRKTNNIVPNLIWIRQILRQVCLTSKRNGQVGPAVLLAAITGAD